MMSFTAHCLTFEYLCFAVLLIIQHSPSSPCSRCAAGTRGCQCWVLPLSCRQRGHAEETP